MYFNRIPIVIGNHILTYIHASTTQTELITKHDKIMSPTIDCV